MKVDSALSYHFVGAGFKISSIMSHAVSNAPYPSVVSGTFYVYEGRVRFQLPFFQNIFKLKKYIYIYINYTRHRSNTPYP